MVEKILSGAFLSLVVGFVTQWLNLLRHVPYLVHPDWENQAGQTAIPFSIALVIVIIIAFSWHGTTNFAAPAAGERRGRGVPRQSPRHLSGALHAGGGDESLPLRPCL
jgi:hypothetical protein